MARKLAQEFEYVAPQFVDFDLTESSKLDDYFNGQVNLWSKNAIDVNEEVTTLSEIKENVEGKRENVKTPLNPTIENLKKDYRVPSTKTPQSASISYEVSCHESPELEYARPWLNKTCSSLINAMDGLNLNSASTRNSLTPSNRNFNLSMETSTPFVTVKERSKIRFEETEKINISNSKNEIVSRVELREIQNFDIIKNTEISTRVKFQEKTELKSAKINENIEGTNDNSKFAKAAEHSSDQIVPIIAINIPNCEENRETKIIAEKSEPDYSKELGENFSKSPAKSSLELEKNPSELTDNLETDEHFEDAETEFVKIDSLVATSEEKEENGGKTKNRKSRIIVNKARRQSLKYRRQSGKFVSMAEAILKFQKGTPKRFHSTKRIVRSESLQNAVNSSRKFRCRRTIASNQQNKETTEKNVDKRNATSRKIAQNEKDKTIKTKNVAETIPAKTTTSRKAKSETLPIKSATSATKTKISSRSATATAKSTAELIPKTAKNTNVEKIATGATKKLPTKANTMSTCSLSFEERNKLLLKKREEFAKRMIEQEKQARIFHARPAPNFKPATIHGSSTENLKIEQNYQNSKISPAPKNSNCLENQENKPILNTEERCRKRRVFDAQIKKKEEEEEARRKREEIERLATMKDQDKDIRKKMEQKAKPVPIFKHPMIAKSKKPLTNPQSPAWSRRTKK